jgi:hypothetical protein
VLSTRRTGIASDLAFDFFFALFRCCRSSASAILIPKSARPRRFAILVPMLPEQLERCCNAQITMAMVICEMN